MQMLVPGCESFLLVFNTNKAIGDHNEVSLFILISE